MSPSRSSRPLSPRFGLALQFANQIHADQVRKGLGAPYISHLMAVCAQVLEYGGDEDQAIAALLHDAAEDCGGRPMFESVRLIFGDGVASIVECCTDTMEQPKPAWRPRKEAYIERMRREPARARLVVTADKLHNLGNTLRDIRTQGVQAWREAMDRTPNGAADKQLWYYRACRDALATGWTHPLLTEFSRAVDEFERVLAGAP